MKLLFIGATATHYIRDNWVNPLSRLYDVVFVNPFWLSKIYDQEDIAEYIKQIVWNNDIKYIFVYSDGIEKRLDDTFYEDLRREHFVFTFYPDDEPEKWYSFHEPYDHRFDLIFTQSLRGHKRREEKNVHHSVYMPWGYNPSMYHKVEGKDKDIDVLYIGTNKIDDFGKYYEEGENRRNLIFEVYNFCKCNGYCFRLYGAGWDRDEDLKECFGGYISDDDIARLICSAKIVLNFGMSFEGGIAEYQTKLRHFEIGGCGTFQITNENPELRELFGDNMGYFSTVKELEDCITYHLQHMDDTQKKAETVYEECIHKHTVECRIKSMIEIADQRSLNHKPLDVAKEPCVQVIPITPKDGFSYEGLKNRIKNGELKITHKYCVFVDDVGDVYFNESLVKVYLEREYDVIGINTHVRFFQDNEEGRFFSRRTSDAPESQIILLYNEKNKTLNYPYIKEGFIGREDDMGFSPLMNYIIKADCIESFIDGFAKDSIIHINEKVVDTGLYATRIDIFSDIRIIDEFDSRLNKILKTADRGRKIVLYGVGGFMMKKITKAVVARGNMDNLFFIDKNLAGEKLVLTDGKKEVVADVFSFEDLIAERIDPEIIVVISMFRNAEIMETLKPLSNKYEIVQFLKSDSII